MLSISASKLAQDISDAISRGDPVKIRPSDFDVVQPDGPSAPEQKFLQSDIVINGASFDRDSFLLTGTAELDGLGENVQVSLHFSATADDAISDIDITAASTPDLLQHPYAQQVREKVPTATGVSLTDVRVNCQLQIRQNDSTIGLRIPISGLGGLDLIGSLMSTSTDDDTVLTFVDLSSDPDRLVWAGHHPDTDSFPVNTVAAWANVPPHVTPVPLDQWTAQSVGLSWGSNLQFFTLILEGQANIFSVSSTISLNIRNISTGTDEDSWVADGYLKVPYGDGDIFFQFDSLATDSDCTLALSSSFDGSLVVGTLESLAGIPFMSQLPSLASCLPTDLTCAINNVSLDNLSAVLDQNSQKVRALGACVNLGAQWDAIPDLFRLDDVKASFLIGPSPADRFNVTLEGAGHLGDLTLDAVARFPEEILELEVQDPFDLDTYRPCAKVLPPFDDDLAPVEQPVVLRDLTARCDLSKRSCALTLALATKLSAPPWFILQDVQIYTVIKNKQTEAVLQAQATIADTTALVSVQRNNHAWSIQGDLDLPDGKSFAQWLQNQFSITLPSPVENIGFDAIRVLYQSAVGKSLDFKCSGELHFSETVGELKLSVNHQNDPSATDIEAQLVLRV